MGNTDRGAVAETAANDLRRPSRQGRTPRPARVAVAGASVAVLLGLTGCGFEVQTLQPYTPAEGVGVDVGGDPGSVPPIKVQGVLVAAGQDQSGFLSAAFFADEEVDQLVGVSAVSVSPDGEPVAELEVDLPGPVEIAPAAGAVVLTDLTTVTISGEGLEPGLTVEMSMDFARAGTVTGLQVPVVDREGPSFATLSPAPATPSAGATPTG